MARASDPKTSVRWTPENYVWLSRVAEARGVGVGTVVQAVVSAARLEAASTQVNGGGGGGAARAGCVPGRVDLMEALEASLSPVSVVAGGRVAGGGVHPSHCDCPGCMGGRAADGGAGRSAAAAGTVPAGAAPVPRPGAAPARRFRLDVAVARVICPGPGPIAPVDRARAVALIKQGRVQVSGVAAGTVLTPEMLVGPGEVVVL